MFMPLFVKIPIMFYIFPLIFTNFAKCHAFAFSKLGGLLRHYMTLA